MVLAFECPWSVTGLGGFIVENQLLVSSDGIEVMNRLPDWLIELR
jgi:Xaa-Pro dipeptidase